MPHGGARRRKPSTGHVRMLERRDGAVYEAYYRGHRLGQRSERREAEALIAAAKAEGVPSKRAGHTQSEATG